MANRNFTMSALLIGMSLTASAHIGSPDVYLDGKAGPYQLFVTIRPPAVIPGVAEIQVRCETAGVQTIGAVPLPMAGPGAKFAPMADKLNVSKQDSQFFTGSLWMMAPGSWEVKLTVNGQHGQGVLSVPFPSAAFSTKKMQTGLGVLLALLGSFLVLGMVAIAGASVREARLPAGVPADEGHKRSGRLAMGVTLAVILLTVWFGARWWGSADTSYKGELYKPLQMAPQVDGGVLTLTLHDPGWLNSRNWAAFPVARSVDDLIPDHEHLMHLYLIHQPGLDVVYHLHPELVQGGQFRLSLPNMQAGDYKLYADIVHQNGFPETLTARLHLPALQGRALSGDDAAGTAPDWNQTPVPSTRFILPDAYRMEWIGDNAPVRARTPEQFRFRLIDAQGRPPDDMALYMGMLGHAAFVKTDGTVFAHIHPTGSVSMAAFMKAQSPMKGADSSVTDMDMPGMTHTPANERLPNEVSFPYGLPTPGRYRIFVQMKHGDTIETGVFDTLAN